MAVVAVDTFQVVLTFLGGFGDLHAADMTLIIGGLFKALISRYPIVEGKIFALPQAFLSATSFKVLQDIARERVDLFKSSLFKDR